MGNLNKMLIFFKLKYEEDDLQLVSVDTQDVMDLKKLILCNLLSNKFNSSYYGDPYSYDWYSSEQAALNGFSRAETF